MRQPPRPREQRLLDRPLLARAYLLLGPIEALAAMSAYAFVLARGGWSGAPLAGDDPLYLQATTATLAAVIVLQVANVFACRSATESVFERGVRGNRLILAGVAVELALVLAAAYTDLGHALLGTAPLDAAVWLVPLPFAVALLALDEARKLVARRAVRRARRPPSA